MIVVVNVVIRFDWSGCWKSVKLSYFKFVAKIRDFYLLGVKEEPHYRDTSSGHLPNWSIRGCPNDNSRYRLHPMRGSISAEVVDGGDSKCRKCEHPPCRVAEDDLKNYRLKPNWQFVKNQPTSLGLSLSLHRTSIARRFVGGQGHWRSGRSRQRCCRFSRSSRPVRVSFLLYRHSVRRGRCWSSRRSRWPYKWLLLLTLNLTTTCTR